MSEASQASVPPERAPRRPDEYGLPFDNWLIGREPGNAEDWALETRLRLEHWQRESTADAQAIMAHSDVRWATGQRPETEHEWDLEYRFRQLNQRSDERESQG